jgi:hypothetical protein
VHPQVLPAALPRLADGLRIGDVSDLLAHAGLDDPCESFIRGQLEVGDFAGDRDERGKPALENRLRPVFRRRPGDRLESRLGATALRVADDEDCVRARSARTEKG